MAALSTSARTKLTGGDKQLPSDEHISRIPAWSSRPDPAAQKLVTPKSGYGTLTNRLWLYAKAKLALGKAPVPLPTMATQVQRGPVLVVNTQLVTEEPSQSYVNLSAPPRPSRPPPAIPPRKSVTPRDGRPPLPSRSLTDLSRPVHTRSRSTESCYDDAYTPLETAM